MIDEVRVLDALIADGAVPAEDRDRLVSALLRAPDRAEWATFVHRLGLGLGAASSVGGAAYLVTFSWVDLGFLPTLLLTSCVTFGFAGVSAAWGPRTFVGSIAAVVGSYSIGANLLVLGVYRPASIDGCGDLLTWAGLALPFALASRAPAAFAMLIALLDLAALHWVGEEDPARFAHTVTALAVANVALSGAAAGTWLAPALRIASAVALVVVGIGLVVFGRAWGAPACGVVAAGFVLAQAAFVARRASAGSAALAGAAAGALGTLAIVFQLWDHRAPFAVLALVSGFALLGATVVGFAWLVGVSRLHAWAGGDA